MPITQIHCLDEAIKLAGGTWNRPEILIQIENARESLSKATNTEQLIQTNEKLAKLLNKLSTMEPLNTISFTVDGITVNLNRTHGRYSTGRIREGINSRNISTCMSKVQSNYHAGVQKLNNEIEATIQRLEEQKDILSSEQIEMERMRLQSEKNALDAADQQRVIEVTKELEEKLGARGFEIRKRRMGKKIVYQAVRR